MLWICIQFFRLTITPTSQENQLYVEAIQPLDTILPIY